MPYIYVIIYSTSSTRMWTVQQPCIPHSRAVFCKESTRGECLSDEWMINSIWPNVDFQVLIKHFLPCQNSLHFSADPFCLFYPGSAWRENNSFQHLCLPWVGYWFFFFSPSDDGSFFPWIFPYLVIFILYTFCDINIEFCKLPLDFVDFFFFNSVKYLWSCGIWILGNPWRLKEWLSPGWHVSLF